MDLTRAFFVCGVLGVALALCVTDTADRVIIEANFGRRCGVRGFLR